MIKMKVGQSIVVNLPIEEIFAYMTDIDNMVEWSSAVIAVRKTSPGAVRVGATFRLTTRFLGRWVDIAYEIVECEPNHLLTLKSIFGIAPCVFCFRLEPLEHGGTNVFREATIHFTEGFLGLAAPAITNAIRRQLDHDLLTLKDLLEARTSTCRNAS